MSDLNQKLQKAVSGCSADAEGIRILIEQWNASDTSPVCCTYTDLRREVESGQRGRDYAFAPNFQMANCSSDEQVVGCSRGCIPLSEFVESPEVYRATLCEACVTEAKLYTTKTA